MLVQNIPRDISGIPHLNTTSVTELAYLQGSLHASDRWFQMDMSRRLANGELSELFGNEMFHLDRVSHTLRLRDRAESEIKQLDPSELQLLSSYASGVNAYLSTLNPFSIPMDYYPLLNKYTRNEILQPHPWTPEDSLAILGLSLYESYSNGWEDLILNIILKDKLEMKTMHTIDASFKNKVSKNLTKHLLSGTLLGLCGNFTESGGTILGTTMNGMINSFNPWYLNSLEVNEKDFSWKISGVSIPGIPLIWMGQNDHISWIMAPSKNPIETVVLRDDDNIMIQCSFHAEDGICHRMDSVDKFQILKRIEHIKVGKTIPFSFISFFKDIFFAPIDSIPSDYYEYIPIQLEETSEGQPIVNDIIAGTSFISLSKTFRSSKIIVQLPVLSNQSLSSFIRFLSQINEVKTLNEFHIITKPLDHVALTMVCGDIHGNLATITTPQNQHSSESCFVLNPEKGMILISDNPIQSICTCPVTTTGSLNALFLGSHQSTCSNNSIQIHRINTVEVASILNDTYSPSSLGLVQLIQSAMENSPKPAFYPKTTDEKGYLIGFIQKIATLISSYGFFNFYNNIVEQVPRSELIVKSILLDFDGKYKLHANAPVVIEAMRIKLISKILQPLGTFAHHIIKYESLVGFQRKQYIYGPSGNWIIEALIQLQDPTFQLQDSLSMNEEMVIGLLDRIQLKQADTNLPVKGLNQRIDQLVIESLLEAIAWCTKHYGSDFSQWKWGSAHMETYQHITSKKSHKMWHEVLSRGPDQAMGGLDSIHRSEYASGIGLTNAHSLRSGLASTITTLRFILDVKSSTRIIDVSMSTGQSSRLNSKCYKKLQQN